MNSRRTSLKIVGLALVLAVPMACLLSFILQLGSHRIIAQWSQPPEISYQSFDPYTLSVVENSRKWNTIGWPHRYQLFIGRGMEIEYGHYLDHSFPEDGDINDYIKNSKVAWNQEGVEFIEADGHRVFIPKKAFIGGR